MYGTVRFFDEFLRGDEYRGILLNLSTSQWISLILIIFAIIILIKNKSKAVE
jgi:phosphatidylglycerol:prolipoprotein diacylglycerol transferase